MKKQKGKASPADKMIGMFRDMFEQQLVPDPIEDGFNKGISRVCEGIMVEILNTEEKAKTKFKAECLRWISEALATEDETVQGQRAPLYVFDTVNRDIASVGNDPLVAGKLAQETTKRTGHQVVVLKQVAAYGKA